MQNPQYVILSLWLLLGAVLSFATISSGVQFLWMTVLWCIVLAAIPTFILCCLALTLGLVVLVLHGIRTFLFYATKKHK